MEAKAFGSFVFDPEIGTLSRDGAALELGTRAAALLRALLGAGGGAVRKDALMHAAWPGLVVEDANLTVQIAKLRKLLGERPEGGEWIATIPRVGYRMNAAAPLAGAAGRSGRPAMAVLPFASLGSDPEQAFFADGVVEEIITALSRFRTFAVIARNSSFVYKDKIVDARKVAEDLGVRYLLEGSVRRSGERIRVAAQLIDGATGEHLWADRLEGIVADVFDFQDQVTRSVAGIVEPKIRQAEIERSRRKRPENLDAWDLYLKAWPLVCATDVSKYTEAIALLYRALELEPGYGPALAAAAWAHEKRHTFGGRAPEGVDDIATSFALVTRAIEANPDDAVALALNGWLRIRFLGDFAAIELCERAVTLNPNSVIVLNFGAVANIFAGDLDRVIAYATRTIELGPGAPNNYVSYGDMASGHYSAGRFEEALEAASRSTRINPGFVHSQLLAAASNAMLTNDLEARAALAGALAFRPELTLRLIDPGVCRFPERRALWLEGLRRAGMPE